MKRLPALSLSIATLCASLVLLWSLTGCKLFGPNPSAPTAFERYVFDVQTNFVPRVILSTNTVLLTNVVHEFRTNEVGLIVTHTNQIVIPTYSLVTITQQVEQYTMTTKTNTAQYVQGAGTLANVVAPGSGGLIVGLLTAGLAAWARLRSHKKTEGTLVQNIESVLEFVEAIPNGSQYTSAIKGILKQDQEDEGQREKIKAVMKENIDASDAKSSANEMQKSLAPDSAANVKPIL